MDIDPQKIAAHPLAAGVLGSIVGLRLAPGLSWLERLTNVITGSLCAGFAALSGSTGITCDFGLTEGNMIVGYDVPLGDAQTGSGNIIY
jgi:hypothetical protein